MLNKVNKPVVYWILGGIAILAGIVSELLSWGTEAMIVGFGLFLLGSLRQTENSLRSELRQGFDQMGSEMRQGFDQMGNEMRQGFAQVIDELRRLKP